MNLSNIALVTPLLAVLLLLVSCGTIKSVNLVLATPPCGDGFCGARMNEVVKYQVSGLDKCSVVRLKFGDGSSIEGSNIDFGPSGAALWEVGHIYTGWPGYKTVTVEGVTNCSGTAKQRVAVLRPTRDPSQPFSTDFKVGFMAGSTACMPVSNAAPLRPGTKVSVITNPDPNIRVNFGCWFSGCI